MGKEVYNNKSKQELLNILSAKQLDLGKLVFVKNDLSQKTSTSNFKILRRDIARIKTLLNQLSK
jgi:ribosomal protein L29